MIFLSRIVAILLIPCLLAEPATAVVSNAQCVPRPALRASHYDPTSFYSLALSEVEGQALASSARAHSTPPILQKSLSGFPSIRQWSQWTPKEQGGLFMFGSINFMANSFLAGDWMVRTFGIARTPFLTNRAIEAAQEALLVFVILRLWHQWKGNGPVLKELSWTHLVGIPETNRAWIWLPSLLAGSLFGMIYQNGNSWSLFSSWEFMHPSLAAAIAGASTAATVILTAVFPKDFRFYKSLTLKRIVGGLLVSSMSICASLLVFHGSPPMAYPLLWKGMWLAIGALVAAVVMGFFMINLALQMNPVLLAGLCFLGSIPLFIFSWFHHPSGPLILLAQPHLVIPMLFSSISIVIGVSFWAMGAKKLNDPAEVANWMAFYPLVVALWSKVWLDAPFHWEIIPFYLLAINETPSLTAEVTEVIKKLRRFYQRWEDRIGFLAFALVVGLYGLDGPKSHSVLIMTIRHIVSGVVLLFIGWRMYHRNARQSSRLKSAA